MVASLFEQRVLATLPRKPERILTDNGAEFVSWEFEQVLQKYAIHHIFCTPYHPQSNGAVERSNQTVIQLLRGLCDGEISWVKQLAQAVMVYNHTWHRAIAMTPSECLLSRSYQHSHIPWVDQRTSTYWKEGHPFFAPYALHDLVLKREPPHGHLTGNKLAPKYSGPYEIVKVHPNKVAYEVMREGLALRAHYTQLKPYITTPKYLEGYGLTHYQEDGPNEVIDTVSDQGVDYEEGYTTDESEACDLSASPDNSGVGYLSGRPLITKGDDLETSLDDSHSSCSERVDPRESVSGYIKALARVWDGPGGILRSPTPALADAPSLTCCDTGRTGLANTGLSPVVERVDQSHRSVAGSGDSAQVNTPDQEILEGEDLDLLLDSVINILEQQESQLAALEVGSPLAHIPETLDGCISEGVAELSPSEAEDNALQGLVLSQGVPDLFSTSGSPSSTTPQQLGDRSTSNEAELAMDFCGFQPDAPAPSITCLHQLQSRELLARLSPVKDELRVARTTLENYKREVRQKRYHILTRYRSSLATELRGSPVVGSGSSSVQGLPSPLVSSGVARRMHTRSQGPVQELTD